ncbi:MAG TPA: N-acetylmuramoyl-L-alanine amidase [Terriglobales bacterium]|nr:N-acetylmuramoyl-L-alanine amidase [Terriglobales bacterium]
MFKIYIDPGHGTRVGGVQDPGAVANGLQESEVVLEVARRVAALLPSWVEALLSRTDGDSPNGIDARAAAANEWGADMVLSLHCNSFYESTANGVEALILGTGGMAELFATELLSYYASATRLYNRGIKVRSDLGILRKTRAPAVLLELGFLSNLSDAEVLRNSQDVIAKAIGDAIVACAKIVGKAGEETVETVDDAAVRIGETRTVGAKVIGGVTYVPLRDIVEALRPTVTWTPEEGAAVTL